MILTLNDNCAKNVAFSARTVRPEFQSQPSPFAVKNKYTQLASGRVSVSGEQQHKMVSSIRNNFFFFLSKVNAEGHTYRRSTVIGVRAYPYAFPYYRRIENFGVKIACQLAIILVSHFRAFRSKYQQKSSFLMLFSVL